MLFVRPILAMSVHRPWQSLYNVFLGHPKKVPIGIRQNTGDDGWYGRFACGYAASKTETPQLKARKVG